MNRVVGSWLRRERAKFWTPVVLVGALGGAVVALSVVGVGVISA